MSYSVKFFRYQLKRLYTEYPEHFFAGTLGIVTAFAVGIPRVMYHLKHPNVDVKAYKEHYTIYRSDDPRSYRIRCTPDLPRDDPHILKI